MEKWRDVVGFEGAYQVSNFGRVRSVDRYITSKHSSGTEYSRFYRGKILTPEKPRWDDLYILYYLKKDGKRYFGKAHRLVAFAFIPRIEGKNFVNHKDCNPKNNNVENLEWVTHRENIKHAYDNGRIDISKAVASSIRNSYKRFKKVYQYTMDKEFIHEFESVNAAAKYIGVDRSSLAKTCRGVYSNSKNYIWSYELL
jgi:uncharacterized protein YktA (UPF0223 family)